MSGPPDAGAPDVGACDAGAPDVGASDVGASDVGACDVGAPDAVPPRHAVARVLPCGEDAVLVQLAGLDAVTALAAALQADPPPGVVDVVPAARTVLVRGDVRRRPVWEAAVTRTAADLGTARATGARHAPAGRVVEIPVVYDGPDLADVARETGLSVEEVVARHLAGGPGGYRVAFGGFVPGFAYVTGVDPRLHVPRLATPRTRVPAGAVALAGDFTAVYPDASPGGWRLLGTTPAVMFDVTRGRDAAALLGPGDAVRFVPARGAASSSRPAAAQHPTRAPSPRGGRAVTVFATGPLVLLEDLGRHGLAAVGVPRSGAADPDALRRANRLVGNRPGAAGLEVLLGGLVLRCATTTAVALTGAPVAAHLDGVPVPHGVAVRAPAGATLRLGSPPVGLRSWLAVRGGLAAPAVLGSRSADVLSGLGPAVVRPGDVLPLGDDVDGLPELPLLHGPVLDVGVPSGVAAGSPPPDALAAVPPAPVMLPASDGPRLDHLDPPGRAALWSTQWEVSPASNRVAVRLAGAPLTRRPLGELPSEGLVAGAVQVPPDGQPVVFGADHPVTGGYPVVAVLTREGRARAAQLRPGDRVRLTRSAGPGAGRPA